MSIVGNGRQGGGDLAGNSGRMGTAFATTTNPREPLTATLADGGFGIHNTERQHGPRGSTVTPTSVEKVGDGARVHVSLNDAGATTVQAQSTVGLCGALSRQNELMAGAVGENCRTSVSGNSGEAHSTAWGRNAAMAMIAGDGVRGTASVATASGGMARASGTNAYAMSWGPDGQPRAIGAPQPNLFSRLLEQFTPWFLTRQNADAISQEAATTSRNSITSQNGDTSQQANMKSRHN